jgi:hypothetical protein
MYRRNRTSWKGKNQPELPDAKLYPGRRTAQNTSRLRAFLRRNSASDQLLSLTCQRASRGTPLLWSSPIPTAGKGSTYARAIRRNRRMPELAQIGTYRDLCHIKTVQKTVYYEIDSFLQHTATPQYCFLVKFFPGRRISIKDV